MRYEEFILEGRNAVLEAIRAGKTIDKLFILDGCHDGPVNTIVREAESHKYAGTDTSAYPGFSTCSPPAPPSSTVSSSTAAGIRMK